MILTLLVVFLGLAGLIVGADLMVDSGRRMAQRFGVSELVVGLVLTSVGTSLPELATGLMGAVESRTEHGVAASDLALGNLIGSNIFLLTGLMGATALARPSPVSFPSLRRDGGVLIGGTVAACLFASDGVIGRVDGVVLSAGFVAWFVAVVRSEWRSRSTRDVSMDREVSERWLGWDVAGILFGLVLLLGSAHAVVAKGVSVAESAGISAALVGVLAGVGTSLPEVVVAVRAAGRGASEVAIGNVVGSGITNLLMCLGLAAVTVPLPVVGIVGAFELPFLLTATIVGLAMVSNHRDLTRMEGVSLVTLFVFYVVLHLTWG